MTTCRRCSECKDRTHHWMPNPEFADDEAPDEVRDADCVCKHCEQLGSECAICRGFGTVWSIDFSKEEPCTICNGEGVNALEKS